MLVRTFNTSLLFLEGKTQTNPKQCRTLPTTVLYLFYSADQFMNLSCVFGSVFLHCLPTHSHHQLQSKLPTASAPLSRPQLTLRHLERAWHEGVSNKHLLVTELPLSTGVFTWTDPTHQPQGEGVSGTGHRNHFKDRPGAMLFLLKSPARKRVPQGCQIKMQNTPYISSISVSQMLNGTYFC